MADGHSIEVQTHAGHSVCFCTLWPSDLDLLPWKPYHLYDIPDHSLNQVWKLWAHSFTDRQTHRHTDRLTDRQTHRLRHTDSQTDSQTDRLTDSDTQTHRQTHRQTDSQTHRLTDRQTHRLRHTDSQTDRQTDRQTHRQTHRLTDRQTRMNAKLYSATVVGVSNYIRWIIDIHACILLS